MQVFDFGKRSTLKGAIKASTLSHAFFMMSQRMLSLYLRSI